MATTTLGQTSQSDAQIIFSSNANGLTNIYSVNPNGSNIQQLEQFPEENLNPSCSSDGTQIAFANRFTSDFNVEFMEGDGSNRITLAGSNTQPEYISANFPTWSPDGNRIAFVSNPDGSLNNEGKQIYSVNTDGTNPTLLLDNEMNKFDLAWSPNGEGIAFAAYAESGSEIHLLDNTNSSIMQLTNDTTYDRDPSWSPDGTRIAFSSDRDGNEEVYVMDSNGSNVIRLTNNIAYDAMPAWSPDGTRIAFVSDRNGAGNLAIYIMDNDGANVQQVTSFAETYVDAFSPCWLAGEPLPSLSIASATGAEGTTITFTVTLDSASIGSFTVDYNVANVTTSPEDFVGDVPPSGTLTFNGTAGEQQFIDIATVNDDIGENGEFFLVQLTNVIPSGDFRIGVTPSDVVALVHMG